MPPPSTAAAATVEPRHACLRKSLRMTVSWCSSVCVVAQNATATRRDKDPENVVALFSEFQSQNSTESSSLRRSASRCEYELLTTRVI